MSGVVVVVIVVIVIIIIVIVVVVVVIVIVVVVVVIVIVVVVVVVIVIIIVVVVVVYLILEPGGISLLSQRLSSPLSISRRSSFGELARDSLLLVPEGNLILEPTDFPIQLVHIHTSNVNNNQCTLIIITQYNCKLSRNID